MAGATDHNHRTEFDQRPIVHPNRRDERDVRPWRLTDGDTRCQECGIPNVVWFTDHELWNRVMPDDGVLCMGCFIHRAEAFVGVGSVWYLGHEQIPTSDEFRRGFSAGQAAKVVSPPGASAGGASE